MTLTRAFACKITTHPAHAPPQDAALVYFDGRLTEAALVLAQAARARGVPVLVEAERLRPSLEALLAEADYVVTSAHFPQVSTAANNFGTSYPRFLGWVPRSLCVHVT